LVARFIPYRRVLLCCLNLLFEAILTGRDLNQDENKVDLNPGAPKNRVKADLFLHIFIFGLGIPAPILLKELLLAANLHLFTKDEMVESTKTCTGHWLELAIRRVSWKLLKICLPHGPCDKTCLWKARRSHPRSSV
jgi:hypothetical protein